MILWVKVACCAVEWLAEIPKGDDGSQRLSMDLPAACAFTT